MITACGIGYCLYVLYEALVLRTTVQGWSSLVCLQVLFNGAILIAVGLVGDYVARIYEESKARPLYVLTDMLNLDTRSETPHRSVTCLHCRESAGTERSTQTFPFRQSHTSLTNAVEPGVTP
jgi:hypothetical protein